MLLLAIFGRPSACFLLGFCGFFLGIHAWNPQKSPKELASSLLALISYNYNNPNTDLPTFSMDILKSAKYH